MARFKGKPTKANGTDARNGGTEQSLPSGVNLGSFYGARSLYDSPVFRQDATPAPLAVESFERLHLALIKLKTPQLLDDAVLTGVAKTLSQLTRLGMACCVVVDPGGTDNASTSRAIATAQADRLARAIDVQPDSKSTCIDSMLSIPIGNSEFPTVASRKALINPLRDGRIAITTPIAYTEETPRAMMVSANDALLALTKELAGLTMAHHPDEDPILTAERTRGLQQEVALDRVILLDPLGGIPAFSGPQTSHAFINLEQEYDDIENELLRVRQYGAAEVEDPSFTPPSTAVSGASTPASVASSASRNLYSIAESNPLSKLVNSEIVSMPPEQTDDTTLPSPINALLNGHLDNLRLSQGALAMLPSASSGIITSPEEVANSAQAPHAAASNLSIVGTRRQRNPLIHNLLTDKPLLSSSLPMSRRSANGVPDPITAPISHTTLVKRGMPLTMFPDPRIQAWTAGDRPRFTLDDPRIDLPRLVHLIEDSFNRKLDVQDYLNRVEDRLAGLIIAGEYEGGAILTWELPPGVEAGSEQSASRMVPYLDKFAVLKRSQGAGGVADIVFNAMLRTCFPNGVCWRSRKDNPVNKWYFERSRGTWKLADSNWTMFWTTSGLLEDSARFRDYEAVCRSIQPSWADNKNIDD